MLAEALKANRQLSELAEGALEENARLRVTLAEVLARDAERDAGAVPQRALSGARAGRRDYSHLPRVEVIWDFEGGGYCCPECGTPFTGLGSDHVTELLDWQVIVRVAAHCRRRYRRACGCRVPAAVTAPGPPKAIGKGLFSNGFAAMLLAERYVAGRSMNSLATGLGRQGAEISAATLAGTCAQAGALLVPLADAVAGSWHLHADETTWGVFAPRDGDGPAKWWLWVFIGPDTVCFVMDPSRSGAVLARHVGIDEKTGQLTADEDGGPREPGPAEVLDGRVAGTDPGSLRCSRRADGRLAGQRRARRAGERGRRGPAGEGARGVGHGDHGDRRGAEEADGRPRPAGTGEEGARQPGPRMGRAHRAPGLPDAVAGQ
jgi:transposase